MKTMKTTIKKRVLDKVSADMETIDSIQNELNQKQKAIAEKLNAECQSQGIDTKLTKDEGGWYFILLWFQGSTEDTKYTYDAKVMIRPQKADLSLAPNEQKPIEVHYIPHKKAHNERMSTTKDLFDAIEKDMYNFYMNLR